MVRAISIEVFIMVAIGLLFGLIGPFGTYEMPPGTRMAFWIGSSLVGYAIFRPFLIVSRWVSEALGVPQIMSGGLALVIAALPLTFLIALFFADFDAARALGWPRLPSLYFQVWVLGFVINTIFVLTMARTGQVPGVPKSDVRADTNLPPHPKESNDQPNRLPMTLGKIHALKGEDHYVRVIGEDGEQLVLMRLRDAIADLGSAEGVQVHRSWWVASSGIAKVTRAGRTAEIVLKNGTTVPVSREMVSKLRALHWL